MMQVDRFLFQNTERVSLMECLHLDKVNINLIHLKDVILILRGYCHALESKKVSDIKIENRFYKHLHPQTIFITCCTPKACGRGQAQGFTSISDNRELECSECQDTTSVWLCVTCGALNCGRYVLWKWFQAKKYACFLGDNCT